MKALPTALLAAALLIALPSTALAQQTGSLTVVLETPEAPLVNSTPMSFSGVVTLVADYTAVLGLSGVPVSYTITQQPEWATVTVSPASDMFPVNSPAAGSASIVASRHVTITVTAAHDMAEDATGVIELTATTAAATLGRSFTGKGATQIAFDAPDEPCPEHAFTSAELAAMAAEAAEAYEAYQAEGTSSDGVTVQTAGASPVATSWMAVGGLGLVGSGVGLLLRRRLG